MTVASSAFVDAFTVGLLISAGAMAIATVAALTLMPLRMRSRQAVDETALGPDEPLERRIDFGTPARSAKRALVPAVAPRDDAA